MKLRMATHSAVLLRAVPRRGTRKEVAKLSGSVPKTVMRVSVSLVTLEQMDAITAAASAAYKALGAHTKVKQSDVASEAMEDWVARWLQRFGPVPDAKKDAKAYQAYVEKLTTALREDGIEALLERKVS